MKSSVFQTLLSGLSKLTPRQRTLLQEHLHKAEQAEISQRLIEPEDDQPPACPRCGHSQSTRWGMASNLQRYRCKDCHATFNALTGTALARLRHKDKWLRYSQQLIEGHSLRKSAVACDVHRNTTFRWRHRFLHQPSEHKAEQLQGIVEADETYFRESFKGRHKQMPRPAHKRGTPAAKRGLSSEHIPVLVCRDRSGHTADYVLKQDNAFFIQEVLKPVLAQECILSDIDQPLSEEF